MGVLQGIYITSKVSLFPYGNMGLFILYIYCLNPEAISVILCDQTVFGDFLKKAEALCAHLLKYIVLQLPWCSVCSAFHQHFWQSSATT